MPRKGRPRGRGPAPAAGNAGPSGWRGKRGDAGPPGSGGSRFRWKQQDDKSGSYWTRLLGLLGVAALLCAVLIFYLIRRTPQTPFVALSITRYESPLIPPNAFAVEDLDKFREHFRSDTGLWNLWGRSPVRFFDSRGAGSGDDSSAGTSVDRDRLLGQLGSQLGDIEAGGPDGDIVLVYLSTHGVVDDQGNPCLLTSDSDPWSTDTWMPLVDVVQWLADFKGQDDKPLKIVLFLDSNRMLHNVHLGLVYNSFTDGLDNLLTGLQGRNEVAIINSVSAEQAAWVSPELRGTAFAHYLIEALNDPQFNPAAQRAIDLHELHQDLATRLDEYARESRVSSQTPSLYPVGGSFDGWRITSAVSRLAQDDIPRAGAPGDVTENAEELASLTNQWEAAATSAAVVRTPRQLAEFQFKLQRLEQLLVSGRGYYRDFRTLLRAASDQLEQIKSAQAPAERSLDLPGLTANIDATQLKSFLDGWRAGPTVQQWSAFREEKKLAEPSYEVTLVGAFQWLEEELQQNAESWANYREVLALLDGHSQANSGPELVEVHFLRMLANLPEGLESNRTVGQAVLTRLLAERAASTYEDPEVGYWIQAEVNEGDALRRLGEDHLFVGTSASLVASSESFEEAQQHYLTAQTIAEETTEAYQVRDAAYALLPHVIEWTLRRACLVDPGAVQAAEFDALADLTKKVHSLSDMLDDPFAAHGSGSRPDVGQLSDEVLTALEQETKRFGDVWNAKASIGDQSAIAPWIALLETPLIGLQIGATELGGVSSWKRNELRLKLVDLLYSRDDTEGIAGAGEGGSAEAGGSDAFRTALFEAEQHPALTLLQRDSLKSILEQAGVALFEPQRRGQGDSPPEQLTHLAAQGTALRSYLQAVRGACSQLSGRIEEADRGGRQARVPAAAADRLARSAWSLLGDTSQFLGTTPNDRLREIDSDFQGLWQSYRVMEGFWAGLPGSATPYFNSATQYLLRGQPYTRYGAVDVKETLQRYDTMSRDFMKPQSGVVRDLGRDQFRCDLSITKSGEVPGGVTAVFLEQAASLGSARQPLTLRTGGSAGVEHRRIAFLSQQPDAQQVEFGGPDSELYRGVEAIALFRGHRFKSRVPVEQRPEGEVIASARPEPSRPGKVRVHANTNNLHRIVLILDVSGSMDVGFEAAGGQNKRWRAALNATDRLLQTLIDLPQDSYQIAVVLYGHRAGWTRPANADRPVSYTTEYKAQVDLQNAPQVHPNEDVEIILDFTELTVDLRNTINRRLNSYGPHGVTPLYYSIDHALTNLVERDAQREFVNHVIVITDGENELYDLGFDSRQFANKQGLLRTQYQRFFTDKDNHVASRIRRLITDGIDLSIDIIGVSLNKRIDVQQLARFHPRQQHG